MVYAPQSLASRQSSYLEDGQFPVSALSGAVTRRANFELAHANISQQISLERTSDIGI
jgi:hypothetical protein